MAVFDNLNKSTSAGVAPGIVDYYARKLLENGDAMGMAAVYEYAEERFEVELDAVDRKLEKYRNE